MNLRSEFFNAVAIATCALVSPQVRAQDEKAPVDPIERLDPEFAGSFDKLYAPTWGDGAIPAKYKHLAGISMSVMEQCEACLSFHIKSAKAAGANRSELIEALRLGVLTGGSITIPTLRQGAIIVLELDHASEPEAR